MPVKISDNVVGALWAKLILNCAYNALSAITQLPYGPRVVQGEGVEAVMRDVVRECLAVAQASGVTVPGDVAGRGATSSPSTMPSQYSSTAQDLARGKRDRDRLPEWAASCGAARRWALRRRRTVCCGRW